MEKKWSLDVIIVTLLLCWASQHLIMSKDCATWNPLGESGTKCFTWCQHHDAAVSFRRKHIYQGIAVLVQGHWGVGLQQLSVDGAQNAHIVVGPLKGNNDE